MANRVLVTDAVDPVCIEMLEAEGFVADVQVKRSNDELKKLAADADGWIIRSGTRITSIRKSEEFGSSEGSAPEHPASSSAGRTTLVPET